MIKNYLTYIKESNNNDEYKVGVEVLMNDDSEYRNQAYQNGGNGIGTIKAVYSSAKYDADNFCLRVKWNNNHINDYRKKDVIVINKNLKKIKNPNDPYGEEDWGWEEIKESNEYIPSGDFAVLVRNEKEWNDIMRKLEDWGCKWTNGNTPTSKFYEKIIEVIWVEKTKYSENPMISHSDLKYYKTHSRYAGPIIDITNKKYKKIEQPDVDPYGEEDWGWEEINGNE